MPDTAPPGFMRMLGDTIGLPGLLASGALGTSTIAKLLGKYGSSALNTAKGLATPAGAMRGLGLGATAFGAGLTPWEGRGDGSFGAGQGEIPQYIKDGSGAWVPNPATKDQQLLKQAGQPATAFPSGQVGALSPMPGSSPFPLQPNGMNPTGAPPMPDAAALSPMSAAMDAQASAPVPLPTPRPAAPAPQAPGAPLSLAPPSPGPTAPPNFYNGPGSQNFGMGGTAPGAQTGGPGALENLQKLFSGQALPAQSAAMQAGNILPFIQNLLSGFGGGSSPSSSNPTQMGSLY